MVNIGNKVNTFADNRTSLKLHTNFQKIKIELKCRRNTTVSIRQEINIYKSFHLDSKYYQESCGKEII